MLFTSTHIKKALYFAAEKHDGQYRKGGNVPYITHPLLVAFEVSKYTNDTEIIAGAILHDTLEDCQDVTFKLLQKEFGNRIAQMVDEVSASGNTYIKWKEKKKAYISKIKDASNDALIIVAVDKMVNMQAYFDALKTRGDEIKQFFGGTPDEYRWYYGEIENILVSKLINNSIAQDYTELLKSYKE